LLNLSYCTLADTGEDWWFPMETRSEAYVPTTMATVPARRCGRCQREFPGDPDLFFQNDWALCPPCAEILMPRRLRPVHPPA